MTWIEWPVSHPAVSLGPGSILQPAKPPADKRRGRDVMGKSLEQGVTMGDVTAAALALRVAVRMAFASAAFCC